MTNYVIKPKVEIYDLKSTKRSLGVVSYSSFTVGEVIIGQSSNASAVIIGFYTDVTDNYLLIQDLEGDFDTVEAIVGNLGGSTNTAKDTAVKTFLTVDYVNSTYGINGTWVIDNEMLLSINDSVKKIDITRGGNFATGYTFSFSLSNITLVKDIIQDGVFLENSRVKYFIDFGAGFEVVWSGILDSIPKIGTVDVKFSCIDSMKIRSNKIGSEKIPICLNQNYNCKLPIADDGEGELIYRYPNSNDTDLIEYHYCFAPNKTYNSDTLNHNPVDEKLQSILFYVRISTEWDFAFSTNNLLTLTAAAGENAGEVYNITKIQNQGNDPTGNYNYYYVIVDKPTTGINGLDGAVNLPITLFKLSEYKNTYNLSNNDVLNVHEFNSTNQKTLRAIKDDVEFYMTKGVNFDNSQKQVFVYGINNERNIIAVNSNDVDYDLDKISIIDFNETSVAFDLITAETIIDIRNIFVASEENKLIYINFSKITFSSTYDSLGYIDPNGTLLVEIIGEYKQSIYNGLSNKVIFTSVQVDFYANKSGSDIELTSLLPDKNVELEGFSDSSVFSRVYMKISTLFAVRDSAYSSRPVLNGVTISDFKFQSFSEVQIDNLAIGCNGENLTSGLYEGYPETIKYIDLTYNNRDISEINAQSFIDAEDEFENFPSYTFRNPAHQIIEQSDFNSVLKDLLYFSHLGVFPDRDDKITISNWLWKSRVFSDTQPVDRYNESFYQSITDLKRPLIVKAITDYELKYNYSEATGEYEKTIRIKNTNLDSFDFKRDTEGVTIAFKKEAEQAWELLRAGYLRTKKLTNNIEESKWIKGFNPDGSNESEAINFIRNQAGHVNRGQETASIIVQLNTNEAIKELLSFDSVYHLKKTDAVERSGWLVESRISWKYKTVTLTYLLDISPKDPFLYRVGIIQDNSTVDDVIVNDQLSTDIINDGGGI